MISDKERKILDLLMVDKTLNDFDSFYSSISTISDWNVDESLNLSSSCKKELACIHRNLRIQRENIIKHICERMTKESNDQ